MERISLLPPEIKALRKAEQKQSRLFFLFLIFLIVLAAVNLFFMVNAYFVRENLKKLQEERAIVEAQAAELLEFEELYQKLGRSEEIVSSAMGNEPRWGVLLRELGNTLPIGTRLSELRISYSNQSGTLNMQGTIYDHSRLADMLTQLHTMEQLKDVQCQVSTQAGTEDLMSVQFTVSTVILTGPEYIDDGQEDGE